MRFFAPWAFWFFSIIPPVIILYILKQKFEEREISSTYLWKQVLKDIDVNTPWQRLKRNILLLLQLLFVTLLVLALADPFVRLKGGYSPNVIIVIDNSGSMNALYNDSTRLENAKRFAESEIRNLGRDAEVTVITCGKRPVIELAKTKDKEQAIARIRDIKSSRAAGSIADATSLVAAIAEQYNSYKAIFYTDSSFSMGNIKGEIVNLYSISENACIEYMSHSITESGLKLMVRVSNKSDRALYRELSIYGDDKLMDVVDVELMAGETKTLYFDNSDAGYRVLSAELSEEDQLADDNVIYDIIRAQSIKKVLLVTDKNVFIEKALLPVRGVELYKTNPGEKFSEEYDLYIFDGNVPEKLPLTGSLMLIDPPADNGIFDTAGETQGGEAVVKLHQLTRYTEGAAFYIDKTKLIEVPYWAHVIMEAGEKPVAAAGENKGRKTVVLAFNLHSSDFVLTPEFPIFMHNALEYLIDIEDAEKPVYTCGDAIEIAVKPNAQFVHIENPEGGRQDIKLSYPLLPYENTDLQGIYRIIQKIDGQALESLFAVNFPISESDTAAEKELAEASDGININTGEDTVLGRRLQPIVILLVLLLAAAEWGVYVRGH
ncbi:MAG: vWA domain-containing protein [Bacillota bacterium]